MVTRFYFASLDAPLISPAVSAVWDQSSTQIVRGILKTQPESKSGGNVATPVKTGSTVQWDMLAAQYISRSLPVAGTLSGTFDIAVNAHEDLASLDAMLQVVIRVVDSTGATVRGTAYAGSVLTTVVSTVGAVNQEIATTNEVRYWASIALTNTAYQVGDKIVVEIGARSQAGASAASVVLVAGDAENVIGNIGDYQKFAQLHTAASYRSWIEFSQDLFGTFNAEELKFIEDSGTLLNSSPSLPFVDITSIDGLDASGLRLQTHDREGIHGGYAASEFETLRTITIEGNIYASGTALETYLDQLKQNFAPTRRDRKFFFGTDAGTRFVLGKSQGLRYPKDQQRRLGIIPFQVQIVCQDPRMYAKDEIVVTGASTIAGTSTWAFVDLASGNRDTPATIRIFGPADAGATFFMYNTQGFFGAQSTPALVAADHITFDMDKRSVTKTYDTNFRSSIVATGDWVNLQPGRNRFVFAHSTGSAYNWSVSYRPAWR